MSPKLFHQIFYVIWTFLRKLYDSIGNDIDSEPILLPTASSIYTQGITIRIYSPPEDLFPADHVPGTADTLSTWFQDKEDFLRSPSLFRPKVSQDTVKVGKDTTSTLNTPSKPCYPNNLLPSAFASSPLPVFQDVPSETPHDIPYRNLSSKSESTCAVLSPLGFSRFNAPGNSDDTMRYSATSIEAPGEIFHSAVEPIRYPVSNFGGLFWDPPSSYFANNAARMVPMPLYTQTPPRLTPTTPIAPKHRASLLPYPDLFDFSMYHSRVSKGSTVDLSFEGLLPDFTSAFDKPHHAKIPGDTVQSRYYERNPEPELFSRVNSRTSFSSCEFEIQDHDLPMHPKSLSLSLSTEDLAKTWGRPTYSSDILDHRSFLSSDDISIRLRIACGDLSQCVWTEEEFLQIIS